MKERMVIGGEMCCQAWIVTGKHGFERLKERAGDGTALTSIAGILWKYR